MKKEFIKRYKDVKARYYTHFDEMCIDYTVVDCMCLHSIDEVEQLLDEYESVLAKISSLIRFYETVVED